jgi:hypothetical protein
MGRDRLQRVVPVSRAREEGRAIVSVKGGHRVSNGHGIPGKERRRVGGTLDAAPHPGLARGRTGDAKPASILRAGGQGNVSLRWCARSLAIAAPSLPSDLCAFGRGFFGPAERPAPPALLCRQTGMERRVLLFEGWLN